ncbi:MAG: hypothetical protein ACK5OP_02205 [Sphingobacteriales bacterium]
MKRVLLTATMAIAGTVLFAQDVKKTKEFITANAWDKAKTSIDATLANPKNAKNPEAWYLKAKVYSALAIFPNPKEPNTFENRNTALEAIKKLQEVDKTQAQVFLTMDQYKPVYDLYTTSFEESAEKYNQEKYPEALEAFKNTGVYGDYIFSQGWGLYKLDTTLTYYTALSALNAKKDEDAVKYFSKLADAKVGGKPEMATSYRYLAKHYYDKKDEANMMKYITAGKELYPKDDYLPLLELDYVRDKGDKAALYKKYDEMLAANPDNFDMLFEYGNELFAETHVADASKRPAKYSENLKKIEELYTKAAALKPENSDVWLSLGKHYYNQALFKEDEVRAIKGAKPEDVKKKADMNAEIVALADRSIAPLEKVFTMFDGEGKLKTHDKSNFKSSCNLLNYAYGMKKDKAKADFYQKKYDEADAKH